MRPRRSPIPAGALVAVVASFVLAVAVLLVYREANGLRAQRTAAHLAADSVSSIEDALRAATEDASALASAGDVGPDVDPFGGASASAMTLARDTAEPVLDDSGVVVVALFDTGAPPVTVQERRDHVIGYRVVPLDLASVVKPLVPGGSGISVSGPNRTLISVPSSGPGSADSLTVNLSPDLAQGWSLTAWTTPERIPLQAWLLAAALLAGGVAFGIWLAVRQRESQHRREELEALQGTNATVAVLATLAQQSLDLGEVLPGVTTELATRLGLGGLSVTVPSSGRETPIFSWGVPGDGGLPYRDQEELAAGQSLVFVLSQGGRTVARLRVTADRDLARHDVRTLQAACDILTSALANAEAFHQQQEVIRRMRAVDELKSAFLATASHELRTPVAAITGYASLLHSGWDKFSPEESRDFAQRLDSVAQRLARLVEEILDFSRIESGNGSGAEVSVLDLAKTVAEVLDEQVELAPDHDIVRRESPGLHVNGSRQAVERVAMNLIGNAAKYSPAGSTIRVITRAADGRAELVVEDEGPGIPAEERDQIFAPFYRGQGNEVIRTRGAGLGLAIASEFAATMDGLIRVEEAPSGGASFVVSYPMVMFDADAESDSGAAHVQA